MPLFATDSPRVIRSRRLAARAVLAAFLLLAGGGCGGSGDLPLDQVDPAAVPADPTYEQVYALLQRSCVSCHGDGEAGEDDGEGLDVRSCVDIVAQRESILERVEANTMPTGAIPRLTSAEKLLIRRWVENGAVAPCN